MWARGMPPIHVKWARRGRRGGRGGGSHVPQPRRRSPRDFVTLHSPLAKGRPLALMLVQKQATSAHVVHAVRILSLCTIGRLACYPPFMDLRIKFPTCVDQ